MSATTASTTLFSFMQQLSEPEPAQAAPGAAKRRRVSVNSEFLTALEQLAEIGSEPASLDVHRRRRELIALAVHFAPEELAPGLRAAFKALIPDLPVPIVLQGGGWGYNAVEVHQYFGHCFEVKEAGHA